jgi:hypothetical protein
MSGYRPPGPLDTLQRPVDVDDGTLCRALSPRPGPAGAADDISRWSTVDKLLEAMRRTTPKLPAEMRGAFASLLSPENIAITAGVLGVWAASHLVGVGEVADVVLVVAGVAILGWQAIQVGRDIADFVAIARNAELQGELDEAADHLAHAVITIGVTVFVAMIMKYGSKLAGRAGRAAATSVNEQFLGLSLDEWLAQKLLMPKAPPVVRQRVTTALKFFEENSNEGLDAVAKYLKAIDFKSPAGVEAVSLKAGNELVMYGDPKKLGQFFAKPGTSTDGLGVSAGTRNFLRLRVKRGAEIKALRSRANSMVDTWTEGRRHDVMVFWTEQSPITGKTWVTGTYGELVSGGATQYMIPRKWLNLLEVVYERK